MIINKNTRIIGTKVILVPYREEHVPKYHQWMQSEKLLNLTASEPLTLEEEYNMQKSWQIDKDKLTFIILDKNQYEETQDEIVSMIGDTNLFFLPTDEESVTMIAEAEIMIAEEWARGNRCGIEAMMIMLQYGINKLKVQHFVVKISDDNEVSLHMFKNLGFIETTRSAIFKEVTMELVVNQMIENYLKHQLSGIQIEEFDI